MKVEFHQQERADAMLTLKATQKILNAMARGTLSKDMRVNRNPTQIIVQGVSDKDLVWIKRNFGEGTMQSHGVRSKRRGVVKDHGQLVIPLRQPVEYTHSWRSDHPPKLEVWSLTIDHEHGRFKGEALVAADGSRRVIWRCGHYGCNHRLTKTQARSLGLFEDYRQ